MSNFGFQVISGFPLIDVIGFMLLVMEMPAVSSRPDADMCVNQACTERELNITFGPLKSKVHILYLRRFCRGREKINSSLILSRIPDVCLQQAWNRHIILAICSPSRPNIPYSTGMLSLGATLANKETL